MRVRSTLIVAAMVLALATAGCNHGSNNNATTANDSSTDLNATSMSSDMNMGSDNGAMTNGNSGGDMNAADGTANTGSMANDTGNSPGNGASTR